MIESLLQALQIPELRKRITFVLGMFAIFVLGVHIPVPGVDHRVLADIIEKNGGLLGLFDVFSGGAFKRMSLFAMGITPYINASIIMQMLTLAIPQLEIMSKEGEAGRKRIAKITRHLTIGIAFLQAIGITMGFGLVQKFSMGTLPGLLQVWITMTAGTCFLLWMGEQITEKGIGNGVSLIIFASIMTSLPGQLSAVFKQVQAGTSPLAVIFLFAMFIGTILATIYVTQGQRKIPITNAKRMVGMRQTQGGSSFLPIKVNTAGVIPVIFAISILMFPAQIATAIPGQKDGPLGRFANALVPQLRLDDLSFNGPDILRFLTRLIPLFLYVLFIVIFTYFYTAVIMNVHDMADNLKKYGNFIPGIRQGKPTFEYLDRVVSRITLAGAVFLAGIALVQYIAPALTGVRAFTLVGGTSLLIVVGVAIETMQAIESQLLMRNYEGFIKQ